MAVDLGARPSGAHGPSARSWTTAPGTPGHIRATRGCVLQQCLRAASGGPRDAQDAPVVAAVTTDRQRSPRRAGMAATHGRGVEATPQAGDAAKQRVLATDMRPPSR